MSHVARIMPDLKRDYVTALHCIYKSGEYSDLVISNSKREYKVHRVIVCSQSEVFKRMLKSGLKEAETGVIDLPKDDPVAVYNMVSYFYTLDYPNFQQKPSQKNSQKNRQIRQCEVHARVYTIADKYQITGLKKLALARFQDDAGKDSWDKKSLLAVAREAYWETVPSDRGLRDAVADLFVQKKDDLSEGNWKDDLSSMGELLYDMLIAEKKMNMGKKRSFLDYNGS